MIITSLNDTFTWYGIRWDVHTVAESTTCTIWVFKACFKHCPDNEPSSTVAYVRESCMFFHDDGCPHFPTEGSVKLSTMALITLS